MAPSTSAVTPTLHSRLTAALRDRRVDDLERALAGLEGDLPAELLSAASDLLMKAQRWDRAAQVLARLVPHSPAFAVRHRLTANLAALERQRPDVYRTLLEANQADNPYRVAPAEGGVLTLVRLDAQGQAASLSPGNNPLTAVAGIRQQLDAFLKSGQPIGLAGAGDGYLLLELARSAPKLLLDQQLPVFLFESDAALLFALLMIHDYTGAAGPIAQPRFRWFVGPRWADDFERTLSGDPFTLGPRGIVGLGAGSPAIQQQAEQCMQHLAQKVRARRDQLADHYARMSDQEAAAPFGPRPSRTPRVLVITSRLTTVLQYAARDVQAAFKDLGWEAELLIEPSAYQQITTHAIIEAIDRVRPDLVFKIDHLNYEYNQLFPPRLATVCWIQDLMPQLTCEKAGQSIDPREFVLTFSGPMFIDRHAYPPEHVIDMPMMLARPQTPPSSWTSDGDDLVYASNVSQPPQQLAADVLREVTAAQRPLAGELCEALLAIYQRGESVPTHHHLQRLAQGLAACSAKFACASAECHDLVQRVWTQLNIALYRQQALNWVVDAADELGLTVALYGHGWEANPRFARFARGFVEPGEPLAQLTRRARINLNLEPYPCFTHHRLLDGLMSGGFFLVREHPGNRLLPALSDLLFEHLGDHVQTADQALAAAPSAVRGPLEMLLADAACLTYDGSGDAVRQVRCWQRAGVLVRGEPAMAHLDDVSFTTSAQARALIGRYIHDEQARRRISAAQRRGVEQRLTFPVGMRRLVDELYRRLSAAPGDRNAKKVWDPHPPEGKMR